MFKSLSFCVVLGALLVPSIVQSADLNAPVAGPMSAGNACFAVFHRQRDGGGMSLERLGPEKTPLIRRLRFENGRSLNGRVWSVTTGPAATLILYNRRNFRKQMMQIGPDSRANLRSPVMDSFELLCAGPPVNERPSPPGFK